MKGYLAQALKHDFTGVFPVETNIIWSDNLRSSSFFSLVWAAE